MADARKKPDPKKTDPRPALARLPRVRCKFDGARLKKDTVGKYCPTKGCQWQHGIPKLEL